MAGKDYYIILGISPSEGAAGIREAFRRLAKKHHPDLGGSEATFQELARAYEVLSDPEQRREYDQSLGRRNASPQAEPLVSPGWSGEHQPEPLVPKPMSVLHGFQTLQPSFDPLFDRMLRNFTGLRVPKGERIEGLNVEAILTPLEAARGATAPIGIPVFQRCTVCHGSGEDWLFPCMACGGQGMIEKEATVSVRIPPMVRDRTIIEIPIAGLGVHNFILRLHVRISS